MRSDLSILSNALEKSNFTAHEPLLANRSGVIAFFNFRIAVWQIRVLMVFYNFAKVFLNSITDYMGKDFRVSIHEADGAKILYFYGIFRFREQFYYC